MGGRIPGKIGNTRVPALEAKLSIRDIVIPKSLSQAAMGLINFGAAAFQMKPTKKPITVGVKSTAIQNSARRMATQAITYQYVGGSFTVTPDGSKSTTPKMMASGTFEGGKGSRFGRWVRGLIGRGRSASPEIKYTMTQYFLDGQEILVYTMLPKGTDDVRIHVECVSATTGKKLPLPADWQALVENKRAVVHPGVKHPRFGQTKSERLPSSEWDAPLEVIHPENLMGPDASGRPTAPATIQRSLRVGNDLGPIISIGGRTYAIGQTLKIGRNRTHSNVVTPKEDPTVSSQHAEFIVGEGGEVMVRDLESTNGTFVNGMRLSEGGFRMLRDGDVVQIGKQQIMYFEQKSSQSTYEQGSYGRRDHVLDVRRDPTNEYRMPTETEMADAERVELPRGEENLAAQNGQNQTQFVDTTKYMSRISLSSRGRDDQEIVLGFSETVTIMGNGVPAQIMGRFHVDHWLKRDLRMMGVAIQIGPDSNRPNARRLYVETGFDKIEVRKAHSGRIVKQSRPVERRDDYTPVESSGLLLENGDTVYAEGRVLFKFFEPNY